MDIETLGQHWETFARTDPLGSILGWQEKRNRNWHPEEFFRIGEREIAETMEEMERAGIGVRRGRALDFGCGAGRLTQALAHWFNFVDGIDISSTMIDLARHYNRAGDRCRYYLNEAPDLALFEDGSFDFIFTRLVLQHMRPEYSQAYIREFMRILAPGGVAAFQMLSRRLGPSAAALAAEVRRDPMPNDAFRAVIVPDQRELVTQPAFSLEVGATVRNASNLAWPDGTRLLRLGNHWLTQDGTMLKESDARAPLPVGLAPGEETHVAIRVRAPAQPGEYLLELDLVQDFVSWFARQGSPASRIRVTVEEPPDESIDPQSPVLLPRMEMHPVSRETVEGLVQAAGGQMLLVRDDDADDPNWESLRYYVRKMTS